MRESKTDKAFTQLNIMNILWKQKLKSRKMNIFERHVKLAPGEFLTLVIVLRFLLAKPENGVNQERTCALS